MPSYASATVLAVLALLVPLALRALHLCLPEAAAEIALEDAWVRSCCAGRAHHAPVPRRQSDD